MSNRESTRSPGRGTLAGMGLAIAMLLAHGPLLGQELLLNSNFADTLPSGCALNLANDEFSSAVPFAMAFGPAEQIDIMEGPSTCGYGSSPLSGGFKIGLGVGPFGPDEFSLELAAPLEMGVAYTVSVHAEAIILFAAPGGLEFGVSNDPGSFGESVGSLTINPGGWNEASTIFPAPSAATYLTIRATGVSAAWTHLDDLSLTEVIEPFRRGDANVDGMFDVADPLTTLTALFDSTAPLPPCFDALDSNDDGLIDLGDPIYSLQALFQLGTPLPPDPGPSVCGADPTFDGLNCAAGCP